MFTKALLHSLCLAGALSFLLHSNAQAWSPSNTFECRPVVKAKAKHMQAPAPTYQAILPTSEKTSQTWKYITKAPAAGWFKPTFNDTAWKQGKGGFGTNPPGHGIVGTKWSATPGDIWLRRAFNPGLLTPPQISRLVFRDYHDEDIQVYINGVKAYSAPGFISAYEYRPWSAGARQGVLSNTVNEIAVHCRQTRGGQYIDVGIYERL